MVMSDDHLVWGVAIFGANLSCFFLQDTQTVTRCLAHIINLTTQALISTRSKAKYYNPHDVDEHLPDPTGEDRDEVGLVRAIVVKVSILLRNIDLALMYYT